MLKPVLLLRYVGFSCPAAFRRLCVETLDLVSNGIAIDPAAFRRLCVETLEWIGQVRQLYQPPSGGCVLKLLTGHQLVFVL